MLKPEHCICFRFSKHYFDKNTMEMHCVCQVLQLLIIIFFYKKQKIHNHSRSCEGATSVQKLQNCWNSTELRIHTFESFPGIFITGYRTSTSWIRSFGCLWKGWKMSRSCQEILPTCWCCTQGDYFSTFLYEIIWSNKLTTCFSLFVVYFLILTSLANFFPVNCMWCFSRL